MPEWGSFCAARNARRSVGRSHPSGREFGPWSDGWAIMIVRALVVVLTLLVVSSGGVLAQTGAQQAEGTRKTVQAALAMGSSAFLTALRNQAVTGQFTLAGRLIPWTVASGGIYAALDWAYQQARMAAGGSLKGWYEWDGGGATIYPITWTGCVPGGVPTGGSPDGFPTHWRFQCTSFQVSNISWGCRAAPSFEFREDGISDTRLQAAYQEYVQRCTAVPQPSLADWIAGTYTPRPGETAVPHPDAGSEAQRLWAEYIEDVNPADASSVPGFQIGGNPPPNGQEWWTDESSCESGSIYNSTTHQCENVTCESGKLINPATGACETPPPCPTGQYRSGSSWSCIPNPSCPSGQRFDSATSACVPDTAACDVGEERDPITNQCRPVDSCPPGQVETGGQCRPAECPAGTYLDSLTNVCQSLNTPLPPVDNNPFAALLVKLGASINRVVSLASNKIPFGLASWFPSFSAAGSACDALDITMNLGSVLGSVTLPICSNMGVKFWHDNIRPFLVAIFSVLAIVWLLRIGLQS
jgi:hypothetical protein